MPLEDFEIGKTLGKGAFGMVCLVKRKIDGEAYAMKRVKIAQLSAKEKENALNEIRILASLSHRNIIGYKEAFFDEDSKTLNIVMEFADDGDISKKIKYNLKNGLLFKENIIWNYLIQILEGLNYLHEKKIIHRDLKSANIFITKNGIIKIGDLNVSKINKLGMAYTQTGTPYYASPEIWIDKPYDYKCDIWSLGCILYELCKLKPPFRGTSLKNLCKNIQEGVYEPIPQIYSNELKSIIGMLLKTNPDQRPSTNLILGCDIIEKKIKELNLKNPLGMSINEGKQALIATIKMPRNMREINRSLPMKRYNNKQRREEMLKEDEFETNKKENGFLDQNDKIEMQQMFGNRDNNNSEISNNNYINNNGNNNFNNNYNNMNNNLNNNNYNNNFINNNYSNNININYNNINNINYNNNYNDLNNNLMMNNNNINYNNNYISDNNNNFNNNNNMYQNNNNNKNYNMYKNNINENNNYNIALSQNYKNYEIKKNQMYNQQQYSNIQNNQLQSAQNPHIRNNNQMNNMNNNYPYVNNNINIQNKNNNNPWDINNSSNEYSNNYSNNNKVTPKFKINNEEDINKSNKRGIHSNKSIKKDNNNNKHINNNKIPQTKNRNSNVCKPKTPNRVYYNQRNTENKNKIERKSNTRPTTANNNNINMRNNNNNINNNKNNNRRNNNTDNYNNLNRQKSKQALHHNNNNYPYNNMARNNNNNNIDNIRINNYEGNMEYYEELNKNCNYRNINIINNGPNNNKQNRKRALSTANPRRVHVNYNNNNNIQQKNNNNINIVNEQLYSHNNYNNYNNMNVNKNNNRPMTGVPKKAKVSCPNINKPMMQKPKRSSKVIIEKYNYQPKKYNRNNSCNYNNNNNSNNIKRKSSMPKNKNVNSKNKRGYEDNDMQKVINNNNVYNYRNYVKNAN